ncbi:peptidase M15 [Streptomyces kanamyceticus]|uniref:Peptidase M15 n=1 Tax=Streptomyces kanamyceticus TaxID=1967 RepID=A0A5J6GR43_STRKN|nr:peptidase M15 [Streptomyces kanamyceticus]
MRWLVVLGLAAALAVLAGAIGLQLSKSSSTSAAAPPSSARSPGASAPAGARDPSRGAVGEADGVVPDGVTVFDDTVPAVSRLDPDLLRALRQAAEAAADDGAEFHVNSGWRSPKYQEQLFRQAVAKYGSEDEAARWVATTATSPHVSGDAADIGESDAAAWLSEHGAVYGLCQIYKNEPWHYELRTGAADHGCPRMYADPTQDPRMQK